MKSTMRPALIVAFLASTLFTGYAVDAQDVRIRLLDLNEPVSIMLSAHEGPIRLYAGDHTDPLTELPPGRTARVSRASDQLHVQVGELGLYAASLRAVPVDDARFGIEIEERAAEQELRRYAGRLYVDADGADWEMKLVNEVPIEEYVASVVASEYGFDDLEGSKAMAVLVRTYTLGVLGKYGTEYDHVDHTLSQVYRGIDSITPVSRSAARMTEGEVLTHGNELIRAVYFASSGGHTADNETVWEGRPLPYLRGKSDPYGRDSPHAAWTTRISRPRLLSELRAVYGANVEGFVVGDRSGDGRVATVDLILAGGARRTISGNDFRLLVTKHFGARAVRSTLFTARRDGDEYVFEGRGFGHGVGLSQWGAHDMALQGKSYAEILDFYYADVELSMLDGDVEEAPEVPAPVVSLQDAPVEQDEEPAVPAPQVSMPDNPEPAPRERRRIGW